MCQLDKIYHLRHILLFEFNRGSNASESARNICGVYGKGFVAERTARKWFSRFKNGNFDMSDEQRTGRPSGFNEERLEVLLQEDPKQTTRELAKKMDYSPQTVLNHLNTMGKVQKLGAWVPHELSQSNKDHRIKVCASLLARHRLAFQQHRPFLRLIVTGDEKWCLYVNMKQRKEWVCKNDKASPRVKPAIHSRKTMLCVWWNMDGIVHFELLERNKTINAQLYIEQLQRLHVELERKYPNRHNDVILQHDNARPHTANLTKLAVQELGWEVLQHPAYSPDLAPSDFHLFRSLQNALNGISFKNDDEIRNWLENWFASKPANFFKHGIEMLPERWEEVVNNGGQYLIC